MKRLAILISGRGSNLEAIVHACVAQAWPAQVVGVVASRADAAGLDVARRLGVAVQVIAPSDHVSREAFDAALAACLDALAADVIVLAGFMRILGDAFVARYAGRLVNIHPSLLPAFPGLNTHRRAIDAGCRAVGATVHYVTPTLDHGPIIAQAVVPVLADDTPAVLAARVLAAEHRLYPLALGWIVHERLQVDGLRVRQLDGASQLLF
ncbi:MAG: phosphoribosylglycinamide formyltransferase [Burkholderiaceae bacterium]